MQINHAQKSAHGMHINKVQIDPRLRQRIPSGIAFIDDAVGYGGFVPSTVTMMTGDPGCGKTTMALQMADSFTKQGHVVLFNTGEQAPGCVAMTAERLQLKHGFYIGSDIHLAQIFAHMDKLKAQHAPNSQLILIQDSLPTILDPRATPTNPWSNGKTPQYVAEALCSWAQSTHAIVIFINHVTKGGAFAGKNTLLHTVDAHAKLYFDRDKKSPTFGERLFDVGKNRWGASGVSSVLNMTKQGLTWKGTVTEVDPSEQEPEAV